ncbi:MAG: hypothetical protein KJZ93_25420 [Caldilineaceae bacterium]|nr:hypothetical protein [Caldilineaceae bacterium]
MLHQHLPDLMMMEANNRADALLADARQRRMLAQLPAGYTLWQRAAAMLQALRKRPSIRAQAPITPAVQYR